MDRVINELHMKEVAICYGMTETAPVSTMTKPTDSLMHRTCTVGTALPHVSIKIVGKDGRVVPRGQTGEFCTRGYSVMSGYWGDPEKTRECITPSGWMMTGDLAVMDDDGSVRIVGRLKDMIIRGGENIYPAEVEAAILSHASPVVRQVQVFGVRDEKFGEIVCAWCIGDGTPEDVKRLLKGKIAHFKIPTRIKFVPEFPLTVTGKPQKFLMRQAEEET
jgi:fatty-acyl-CoA synthase